MIPLLSWHRAGAESKRQLVVGSAVLLLVGTLVLASVALFRPASHAHAATPHRLDTFTNNNGTITHRWSDNGGATWSAWTSLSPLPNGHLFLGTPAVVSDGVALLTVVARTTGGNLEANTYNNGTWSGWNLLPGEFPDNPGGWDVVEVSHWCVCLPPHQADLYQMISSPVLTSSGPNQMELFVYGSDMDGTTVLLHTWTDGGTWSGNWEVLGVVGPGLLQDAPAAVSWASGRTDVFFRGTSNELEHLSFDNGQWASSWENLGTPTAAIVLGSSPTVASSSVGSLNVFARGSDGNLWANWYSGVWHGWTNLGCCLAGDVSDSVAVTSVPGVGMYVFVVGTQHDFYNKVWSYAAGAWSDWQFLDHSLNFTNIATTSWVPISSDQPDPTPTPKVPCGGDNPCKQPQ